MWWSLLDLISGFLNDRMIPLSDYLSFRCLLGLRGPTVASFAAWCLWMASAGGGGREKAFDDEYIRPLETNIHTNSATEVAEEMEAAWSPLLCT